MNNDWLPDSSRQISIEDIRMFVKNSPFPSNPLDKSLLSNLREIEESSTSIINDRHPACCSSKCDMAKKL